MATAENLRNARKAAGLTQEQAAAALGIPQSQIAKWETGKRIPKLPALKKLAALYQCPLDKLIED